MKIKQPMKTAEACVIWLHGLGSNAANMMALVEQLSVSVPIKHVCLEAPVRPVTFNNQMRMQAWYDIYGLQAAEREDRAGILASQQAIEQVMQAQCDSGIAADRIFLAGFSQGAAMALFTGLHTRYPIAGLICLSGYLPLAATCQAHLARHTPLFMALGLDDQVVIPAWTIDSVQWLQAHGYQHVVLHQYPMQHSICMQEIQAIAAWLTAHAPLPQQQTGDVI